MTDKSCYHCGLPVPENTHFTVEIKGEERDMCCPGCQAVASAICEGGLSRFYQYRATNAVRPETTMASALLAYDLPEVQGDYVEKLENGHYRIQLLVGGITCAACAWLIEQHLKKFPAISSISINVTSHRAMVEWDMTQLKLSELLTAFLSIGYDARPASDEVSRSLREKENRRFIQRLGVAGLGMMQAGMIAVGLYAGAFQGMEPEWQNYLRWVSLVIALPVVLFSAYPFFHSALRNLRMGHLTMDVPVSLAIGLAFSASCWATVTRTGEVYFDSVSMFTFFLLLGRYLEMRVRHRNDAHAEGLGQLLPPTTVKISEQGEASVPVRALKSGDLIRVAAGETIPCDGVVHEGASSVVEAVLTGEQMPVSKRQGDAVSAGTINSESPLLVTVSAVGKQTRLAAILSLVEQAKMEKPVQVALADRVAGHFVMAVLVVASVVAYWWWQHEPQQAIWVVLSVLVVTCPCALSLATPAAMAVATGALREHGFLVVRGHVIEALALADRIIFDKTGTLTLGNMSVSRVIPLSELSEQQVLQLAAGLENGSLHPIAKAFSDVADKVSVSAVEHKVGAGISGSTVQLAVDIPANPIRIAIGTPDYIADLFAIQVPELPPLLPAQLPLLLASEKGPLGWLLLQDQLRPRVSSAMDKLREQGLGVLLLSGDRESSVAHMAETLNIEQWHGAMSPAHKLEKAKQLQQQGHRVVMVGDGINDVPVLSGADVSVALGDASDFARIHADSIMLSGNLDTLPHAIDLARATRRVIRQNLGWALFYNLLALPLAAAGLVPPWAAAIGMSLSSLLVILNALRLNKKAEHSFRGYPSLVEAI